MAESIDVIWEGFLSCPLLQELIPHVAAIPPRPRWRVFLSLIQKVNSTARREKRLFCQSDPDSVIIPPCREVDGYG